MATQLWRKKTLLWRRRGGTCVTGDPESAAQRAQIARCESWHFLARAVSPARERGRLEGKISSSRVRARRRAAAQTHKPGPATERCQQTHDERATANQSRCRRVVTGRESANHLSLTARPRLDPSVSAAFVTGTDSSAHLDSPKHHSY